MEIDSSREGRNCCVVCFKEERLAILSVFVIVVDRFLQESVAQDLAAWEASSEFQEIAEDQREVSCLAIN